MAMDIEDYSIDMLKEMQRESGISNSKRLISILMRKIELMEEEIVKLQTEVPKKIQAADEIPFWDGEPASSGIVPFPISGISEGHSKELFDDIEESIKQRIEVLSRSNSEGRTCISCDQTLTRSDRVLIEYYESLLEKTNLEDFRKMQKKYLVEDVSHTYRSFLKFLHPTHYFESKINLACLVGLEDSEPLRILDIGSGAGHFLSIAEFFGHKAIGLDLADEVLKKGDVEHPYRALCGVFGVKREFGRIEPTGKIPEIKSGPFDLITAFLPAFNIHQNRDPWDEETWEVFFRDVSEKWLPDGGRVFFQFTTGKMDEKSWLYFREKSDWMDKKSNQVLIKL